MKTNRYFLFLALIALLFNAVPSVIAEETAGEPEVSIETFYPTVYIVPLGGEMNLKVDYPHPMDFEGGNFIEAIQMETLDGNFLGLKTFNERATKPYAEFMVNPKLADFDEVALVARSKKLGEIRTTVKLEFTPEENLPDELNPKKKALKRAEELAKKREAALKEQKKLEKKKGKASESKISEEMPSDSEEDSKKKKRFGLF